MMFNIKLRVKNLVKKYGTSSPDILAQDLGIDVCELDLPRKVNGFFVRALRKKFIVLNTNLTEIEREIVLSHEIGHVRLHRGYGYYFSMSGTCYVKCRMETEANIYAIQLLSYRHDIDADLLESVIKNRHPDPCIVHKILTGLITYEFNY